MKGFTEAVSLWKDVNGRNAARHITVALYVHGKGGFGQSECKIGAGWEA